MAPPPGTYAPGFDALDYDIALELPREGKQIRGRTRATIQLTAPRQTTLALDLTGLIVDRVALGGRDVTFSHRAGKLLIPVPNDAKVGEAIQVEVDYRGEPDDGLLIRSNVHGERTVFADNWPDRARFWFPSIDHPSDKATAAFTVTAPVEWTVLANGAPISSDASSTLAASSDAGPGGGMAVTRWRISQPTATYTMVIGAARLRPGPAAQSCVDHLCVDVSWWAFPQDHAKMEPSFRRAPDMLRFFTQLIAPYEFERLAHVQSSTEFEGMENTTAIFYSENEIAAGENIEDTVAHETAHQWFGNSVTIRDWHELWLSEGFATYLMALYYQHADGEPRFRAMMEEERQIFLQSVAASRPVIDRAETNLEELLNANTYQKGAWILHMLRGIVGDEAFFSGIRRFYQSHRLAHATTADLRNAFEAVTSRDLEWFFTQWLDKPGYPRLRGDMKWDGESREVSVTIEQTQHSSWPTYRLPLVIELSGATSERHHVDLTQRKQTFVFRASDPPRALAIDPDSLVLKVVEQDQATGAERRDK